MRLVFDTAALGTTPKGGVPTVIKMTSIRDGGVQTLNARHLKEWSNMSACFNGDLVLVQILADAAAAPSRIAISKYVTPLSDQAGVPGICGTNDRVLSDDPAVARIWPGGCTAWIIDDANHTMLGAGHCTPGADDLVQFNVPLSSASGTPIAPPPEDQYAVDLESIQYQLTDVGHDWAYFGCFPNPDTGLTPFQAQRAHISLATATPALQDPPQALLVTGYGQRAQPEPLNWNAAQRTAPGPYAGFVGTEVHYSVDVTGGNSGSPIIDKASGLGIGIVTHGGCNEGWTYNHGTSVTHPNLLFAIAHPRGVCIPPQALTFNLPDGTPEVMDPAGGFAIRVEVGGGEGGTPQPGTGMLHLSSGGAFTAIPMEQVSDNVYDAVLPATACLSTLTYYFSAQTTTGQTFVYPPDQPWHIFTTDVYSGHEVLFEDNLASANGWTVTNSSPNVVGGWELGVPSPDEDWDTPTQDADGNGTCFMTGAALGVDLSNGTSMLVSPKINVDASNVVVHWWQWIYYNVGTSAKVEFSFNDGATWVPALPSMSISNSWKYKTVALNQVQGAVPTDAFRIRFTVTDPSPPQDSQLEMAIDGIMVESFECPGVCVADLDESGVVGGVDLGLLLGDWGRAGPGDLDGSGVVNGADLGMLLGAWGACPGR